MPHLTIDLQEGFAGDAVELRLNGRLVYQADSVSTRTQIGLADRFETDVDAETVLIEVEAPGRGLHALREVQTSGNIFVGATIDAKDGFVIREQSHEFWYA